MGTVLPGDRRKIFIGEAEADGDNAPTLNEALESAAGQAIEAGVIGGDKTAWFDVLSVEVKLGNQHPRTFRVKVTPKDDG